MLAFAFVFNDSWWWLLPALLLASAYSYLLYQKSAYGKEWQPRLLAALRFLTVFLVCLLLINPLIKTVTTTVEKPVIVIAQDNSSSILLNKYKNYYTGDYLKQVQALKEQLAKKYDVRLYTFGGTLEESGTIDYSAQESNLSEALSEINDRYANRNVGALILASDGLYNQGSNPYYTLRGSQFPVYTIALGDTNPQRDLLIGTVEHNRLVNFKNDFRINAIVKAQDCANEQSLITVEHDGKTLFSQGIVIKGNRFRQEIPIDLNAEKLGFQHYKIKLSTLSKEVSTINNVQDIFIEVIDGKQTVLLLAASPHPDLSALKQSIEENENYTVAIRFIQHFELSELKDYQVVLLHQLPSDENNLSAVWKNLQQKNIPTAFIIGNQTNLQSFNQLQTGLNISGSGGRTNEAQALYNEDFYSFHLSEAARQFMATCPPLSCPYGNYNISGNSSILFYQRIGQAQTILPLLLTGETSQNKVLFICGEGFWRWRLFDYAVQKNQDFSAELCSQLMQYLSTKEDKRKFRVRMNKNRLSESESIVLYADLFDDNNQPLNDPDVTVDIIAKNGKKYPYTFSKTTAKSYQLDAGSLPQGEYRYLAKTKLADKNYEAAGNFIIQQQALEALQTTANHQLLYALSSAHGGMMVNDRELQKITDALEKNELVKTVSYENKNLRDLINWPWLLSIILFLISAEWFLRKRSGSY